MKIIFNLNSTTHYFYTPANYSECYPSFCVQGIGLIHANNTAVLEKSGMRVCLNPNFISDEYSSSVIKTYVCMHSRCHVNKKG